MCTRSPSDRDSGVRASGVIYVDIVTPTHGFKTIRQVELFVFRKNQNGNHSDDGRRGLLVDLSLRVLNILTGGLHRFDDHTASKRGNPADSKNPLHLQSLLLKKSG